MPAHRGDLENEEYEEKPQIEDDEEEEDPTWALRPASKRDFQWSKFAEPHKARNRLILKEFPEIKKLMGHDPATKYKIFCAVALQVCFPFCKTPLHNSTFALLIHIIVL